MFLHCSWLEFLLLCRTCFICAPYKVKWLHIKVWGKVVLFMVISWSIYLRCCFVQVKWVVSFTSLVVSISEYDEQLVAHLFDFWFSIVMFLWRGQQSDKDYRHHVCLCSCMRYLVLPIKWWALSYLQIARSWHPIYLFSSMESGGAEQDGDLGVVQHVSPTNREITPPSQPPVRVRFLVWARNIPIYAYVRFPVHL